MNLLIMLLAARAPVTSAEIKTTIPGYDQENDDTFRRMLERDKQDLREMGIQVDFAPTDIWEVEKGYRIVKEDFYLPDVELTSAEAAALWLAVTMVARENDSVARNALLKLAGGVPEGHESSGLSADVGLSDPNLTIAFEAVSRRRSVTFQYRKGSDAERRTLDPYNLKNRRGAWYLIGRDHDRDATRAFRLDRIRGTMLVMDPGGEPSFSIPDDLDLSHVLDSPPFVVGDDVFAVARVRFEPTLAWWVGRTTPWLRLEDHPDGSAEADLTVTNVNGFIRWLFWFGEDAHLLSPQHLIDEVRSELESRLG